MSEEVAIRIAEALEGILRDISTGLILLFCLGCAFWVIAMFKN